MRSFQQDGISAIDGQVMRDILKSFGATDEHLNAHARHWNGLPDDPTYDFRKTSQTRWNHGEDFTEVNRLERSPFRIPYAENALLGKSERFFPEATVDFLTDTVTIANQRFMRHVLMQSPQREECWADANDNLGYISGSHQFRIEVKPLSPEEEEKKKLLQGANCPTPEGVHQDGAWAVMIQYIHSGNMGHRSGESRIYSLDQPSGQMTGEQSVRARRETRLVERNLTTPFETLLINDRKVKHDNKPIIPADKTQYAFRDVHVIWARRFNEDDKADPRGQHSSHPVKISFKEDDNAQVLDMYNM